MPDMPFKKFSEPYETRLGDGLIVSDGVVVAVVSLPEDATELGDHAGKTYLLFDFAAAGHPAAKVLLALDDYTPLTRLVADAVEGLTKAPPYRSAPKDVRCPGCNTLLHGAIARRGACTACYPELPGDEAKS